MSPYQELQSAKYLNTAELDESSMKSSSGMPLRTFLKLVLVAAIGFGGAFYLFNSEKLKEGLSKENIENFRRNPINLLIFFAGSDYMDDAQNKAEWRRYERERRLEEIWSPDDQDQWMRDMQHENDFN